MARLTQMMSIISDFVTDHDVSCDGLEVAGTWQKAAV